MVQHISYQKYTYAFDDSLKLLIVGLTWRLATAKGLKIETAAISMGIEDENPEEQFSKEEMM